MSKALLIVEDDETDRDKVKAWLDEATDLSFEQVEEGFLLVIEPNPQTALARAGQMAEECTAQTGVSVKAEGADNPGDWTPRA